MYKHFFKRIIDLVLSTIGIMVLAFPMLIIAIAIKIDDPGPVLFKQRRVGQKKNGKITYFMIWKFRSMNHYYQVFHNLVSLQDYNIHPLDTQR